MLLDGFDYEGTIKSKRLCFKGKRFELVKIFVSMSLILAFCYAAYISEFKNKFSGLKKTVDKIDVAKLQEALKGVDVEALTEAVGILKTIDIVGLNKRVSTVEGRVERVSTQVTKVTELVNHLTTDVSTIKITILSTKNFNDTTKGVIDTLQNIQRKLDNVYDYSRLKNTGINKAFELLAPGNIEIKNLLHPK